MRDDNGRRPPLADNLSLVAKEEEGNHDDRESPDRDREILEGHKI